MRPNKTVFSKEHCEKISKAMTGKRHSPETIAKMKETYKRRMSNRKKTVNLEQTK